MNAAFDMVTPVFLIKREGGAEDDEKMALLWMKVIRNAGRAPAWPLISHMLEDPKAYGVKSPIRQEVMSMVGRTLGKMGFSGSPKDCRMVDQIIRYMKTENAKGGLF
jgi:hypothetical protein